MRAILGLLLSLVFPLLLAAQEPPAVVHFGQAAAVRAHRAVVLMSVTGVRSCVPSRKAASRTPTSAWVHEDIGALSSLVGYAIFTGKTNEACGFVGAWIESAEDVMKGLDELRRSAEFLDGKARAVLLG